MGAKTLADIYPRDGMLGRTDLDVITPAEAVSLAGMFRERVKRSGSKRAFREYDANTSQWTEYSWNAIHQFVSRWQQAMLRDGVEVGDRVALRLKNGTRWIIVDQAVLGLGAVVVPLYVDDRADNVSYILDHTQTRLLLLETLEQWECMSDSDEDLSCVKRIVVLEPGVNKENGRVVSLDNWLENVEQPDEMQVVDVDTHALASIVYTSGTTGRPKGVMLSHANMMENCYSGMGHVPVNSADVFLSFLPLSHTLERTVGYYLVVMGGAEIAFTRSIPELIDDLGIIRPTFLVSVPRIYERAYNAISQQLDDGPAIKKKLFDLTESAGWHRFEQAQGRASWHPKLLLWPLLNKLVASKVKNRFGGRMRVAVSGGAPLPGHVGKRFISLGLPIFQGYGLTETSPMLSANCPGSNIPWSIGLPLKGVEIKLGERDELLARGPNIMLGYWKNEQATKEALDEDGWFHTGDCARIDENGFIYITGRIKEILVLSNGEKVPPADIESAIAEDILIEHCMILGEQKSYLSAVLVLDKDQWTKIAKQQNWNAQDETVLKEEAVEEWFKERIKSRLDAFPGYARIRRITATLEPWSVDNNLLTPTLKLKRKQITERFADDIERMYAGH